MSKGSGRRPEDKEKFDQNYDRIFNRDRREEESGLIELEDWTEALYPKENELKQD